MEALSLNDGNITDYILSQLGSDKYAWSSGMLVKQEEVFLKLYKFYLLQIRLSSKKLVDANEWGLADSIRAQIPLLYVLVYYNVFLQKNPPHENTYKDTDRIDINPEIQFSQPIPDLNKSTDALSLPWLDDVSENKSDEEYYVVLPEIIIKHYISRMALSDLEKFPFFNYVRGNIMAYTSPGIAFEIFGLKIILDRFELVLGHLVSGVFPFLRDTFSSSKILIKGVYLLPRICFGRSLTSKSDQELRDFLETKVDFHNFQKSIDVHADEWPRLLNLVKEGVLYYSPSTTSSSADLYVFWSDTILCFQFKAGAQTITPSKLVQEAEKTLLSSILSVRSVSLVFFGNSSTTLKADKDQYMSSGYIISYSKIIQNRKTDCQYTVPKNAEIILLSDSTRDLFFSSSNSQLLK